MCDLLNGSQRRAVTIALRMFEERLREAELRLKEEQGDGILYHRRLNVSSKNRNLARQRISAALDLIVQVAKDLKLEPETQDLANEYKLGRFDRQSIR
jgi:hypothetical protein